MIKLGVNIDHIATLRQARHSFEPNPVFAVNEAFLGGADSITIHLREDERHINYDDALQIRKAVPSKLNLEMSIDEQVVEKALTIRPRQITIVPERRQEITTESGLNVKRHFKILQTIIKEFKKQNVIISLFIDAEPELISLAKDLDVHFVEIHTGPYANADTDEQEKAEFHKILAAAEQCLKLNIRFNAGHGLNYQNIFPFLKIQNLYEVNIGHSIVARSVFTGLRQAVKDMRTILNGAHL